MTSDFRPDESFALELDARDPLAGYRERFHIPRGPEGGPVLYFCGHSLGLQPRSARRLVEEELTDWADLGVDGHSRARRPWYSYHERLRETGARLVGALPGEVVMMNALTVNLHLMMATFYRPTPERHAILIERRAFPSDRYAVVSQIRHHRLDPAASLLEIGPRGGENLIRTEEVEALLARRGPEIALVLLPGVQYATGQVFDLERIAAAARRQGCAAGFDLAHAAGNVLLSLHDWEVDFAVWCSYKYLNAGPGAVAGCFVHQDHGRDLSLPRLAGWWGTDPDTRFQMQPDFLPGEGADGWQVSNPPILSMAPLLASLEIFDEAGLLALRAKSILMGEFLLYHIDRIPGRRLQVITPRDARGRGCQVSIRAADRPRDLFARLAAAGVVADFREPDLIRVAPVPLYNTFHEIWRFAQILGRTAP